MTIRHVICWKLSAEDATERAEHAAEMKRRLEALEGKVSEILRIEVGLNALYPESNWDITLSADFADQGALEAYLVHPSHLEVVAYVRSVVSERVAVDYVIDSEGR